MLNKMNIRSFFGKSLSKMPRTKKPAIVAKGSSIPEIQSLERVLVSRPTQLALVEMYRRSQSEHARNGKCTMEIGSSREKDFVALLMEDLGESVCAEIDNSALEDMRIGEHAFSIKHVTGPVGTGSVKAKWTADADQARTFVAESLAPEHAHPHIIINYVDVVGKKVTLNCIESARCTEVIHSLGEASFIVAAGTNNRGVGYSRKAIEGFLANAAFRIEILDADLLGGLDPYLRRRQEIRMLRQQLADKAADEVAE
jgi:hypothetical protein